MDTIRWFRAAAFTLSLSVFLSILQFSCRKDPGPCLTCPPPYVQSIFLDTLSVDVTEMLLRVRTTDTSGASTLQLYRDSLLIADLRPLTSDTLVLDTGLAPARTYNYKAYRLVDSQLTDSTTLPVTTMDTTTHNFIWQIDTLGDGTSVLHDVAIIDEQNIWVVGQMYLRDSSGQIDPIQYNLARWDGTQWNYVRVMFPICNPDGTEIGTAPFVCTSIFAFEANDIWLTSGGNFAHWNGSSFQRTCLVSGTIQGELLKLWGISSSNLYCVGRNGTVIRYNGSTWQSMPSGTDVDLLDVWGSPDGSTVWACGYKSNGSESILLRYDGTQWEEYGHAPPQGVYQNLFAGVWFARSIDSAYVIGDRGVFRHAQGSPTGFRRALSGLPYFPHRIRGVERNDVVLVGDAAMIWHFNGLTWRFYDQLINTNDRLRSVAIGRNQIIAVGYRFYGVQADALIYRGRR